MANLFLKVDKRFYFLGVDPLGILILSQINEYTSKGMTCFISNEQLAKQFGSSLSTVKRTITNLEKMGYLNRDTKNTNQGKERFLTINEEIIESTYAKAQSELCQSARLTENLAQGSICPLGKGQNGPIKDKSEEQAPLEEDKNKKDKLGATTSKISYEVTQALKQSQILSEIQKNSKNQKEKERNKIDINRLPLIDKEEVDKNPNRYVQQDNSIVVDFYTSKSYRIKEKE